MLDGLCPYPAYQRSGVPWLGHVPEHWEVRRAKTLYREVDERSTTGTEELMSVSHKTGVTPRKQTVTMFLAESNVGYKVCRPGDIVINTMWAYMAALEVARQNGLVSPSYGVYRPLRHENLNPDYIDLLLRTEEYRTVYLKKSTGITDSRLRLYPEQFLGIPLLCPSLTEQAAIVRYLDHADRRIRCYVSAKRRLIALLEEEKQAVVNHAVTRGLDPNVRLKSSGAQWLGDVPAHWEVRRLKASVSDVVNLTDRRWENEAYIALEHVEGWTGRIRESNPTETFESQVKRFEPGDVLFGKLRPYLAKVTHPARSGVCVGEFLVLRPRHDNLVTGYLVRLLRSKPIIDAIDATTFGAKMPRADWHTIGNMNQPLPPLAEQSSIVEYLDKTTAGIDAAIARSRRQIELLEEYRTRLIADVVTGKLDAREAAAKLPGESDEDRAIHEDRILSSEGV